MKQVIMNIPQMQSTHCQTRVSNAIKQIDGVQVQKLEAGKLTVSLTDDNLKQQVENAIAQAGYKVANEEANNDSACATGCCTSQDSNK